MIKKPGFKTPFNKLLAVLGVAFHLETTLVPCLHPDDVLNKRLCAFGSFFLSQLGPNSGD